MLSLGHARRTWQSALRIVGVPEYRVCLVNSSSWQAAMLGRGYKALGGTKAASCAVAAQLAGCAPADLDDDTADAICLGAFFCQIGSVAGFRARAADRATRKKGTAAQRQDALDVFRDRGCL